MIEVGVIGYGYWGPNIVRNLHGLDSTRVEMVCDKSRTRTGPRAKGVSRHPSRFGSRGDSAFTEHRRGGRDHARLDPLRAGQGGAGKRQTRLRRETVHLEFRAGRRADRAGGAKETHDHGGPHVPVHRRGAQDPRADGKRRARRPVLLRFAAREPGPVPARRQRDLGPCAA